VWQTLLGELAAWSKLLRENFVIVLLTILYILAGVTMLHADHDSRDGEVVPFIREAITAIGGCLFGMLTKNTLTGRGSGEPAATTTTTTTVRAEGGPPIPPVTPVIIEPPKPEAK